MVEQVQNVQEKTTDLVTKVAGLTHKTFLLSLGALDLTQEYVMKGWETGNEFAGKLVERGEKVYTEGREQVTKQVEKRQEQAVDLSKDVSKKTEETFVQYSDAVLTRANIPTRTDIQDLSKQINSLSRKVDKVRKEQQEVVAVAAEA